MKIKPNRDKLTEFLKTHRPKAPEPKENELQSILQRIESEGAPRRRPYFTWWRLAIPVAVAASFVFFMIRTDYDKTELAKPGEQRNAELAVFLDESYATLYNGNENTDPAIGDEWLELVP